MEPQEVLSLKPGAPGAPIEVRLLRKWTPHQRPNDACYVFIDKHGSAIQGLAHKKREKEFVESRVVVQSCYRISDYVCVEADTYMKAVAHATDLRIGPAASITLLPDDDAFPRFHFEFCAYRDLNRFCGSKYQTVDYIGMLEDVYDQPTKDGSTLLRLTLKDQDGQYIVATLWPEILNAADRIDRHSITRASHPAIVTVTSMKVGTYQNRMQLLSTSGTYVYLNPEIPLAQTMLARIDRGKSISHSTHLPIRIALRSSGGNKITLSDLLHREQQPLLGRTFTCDASIKDFVVERSWYYTSCPKCTDTIFPSGDQWRCPSDGSFDTPTHKYSLTVVLADASGTAIATLFDSAVKGLVQTECSDLVINAGYTNRSVIPSPLQTMKGQLRKFHLQVQPSSGVNFTVNRISAADIIPLAAATTPAPSGAITVVENPSTPSTPSSEVKHSSGTKRSLIFSPDIQPVAAPLTPAPSSAITAAEHARFRCRTCN